MSRRSKFEEHMRGLGYSERDLRRNQHDQYRIDSMEGYWTLWNAAIDAMTDRSVQVIDPEWTP